MSDGLEKAAGARLRSILEFFTRNRVMGLLVGMLVTAVIQSSSATTVIVVSFVNAGLMNLMQATGVILGANIGTAITSQLIAFNLSEVAPLFVMAGVVLFMFCKKPNTKNIGEVVLGFGILFMGLSTMSDAMSSLRESPQIVELLGSMTNPFVAIFAGFAIAAILQSSSATVGIILLLASQGLLPLEICFFLILGCNIGSCVSALIASLGGNKDAKRAAMIHFLFNVIGSAVILVVLLLALDPITTFVYNLSGGNIARSVANAHTIIKVAEVILLFPFMNWIVKATYVIIPGEDENPDEEFRLIHISPQVQATSTAVIVGVVQEIERMGEMACENLRLSMEGLISGNEAAAAQVYEKEKYINYLNHAITDYLVEMNKQSLPNEDASRIGGLFHVVNDIERIGDHAENVADSILVRKEQNLELPEKSLNEVEEMTEKVIQITKYALDMFSNRNQEHLNVIMELEDEIDAMERKLQRHHVKRLTKNKCTPQAGMIFSDVVSGLERVADHATNIAYSILEEDPEVEEDPDEI